MGFQNVAARLLKEVVVSDRALMRMTVVLLTYNRCSEVLRTLRRLELALPDVPVVVVDNASADDTVREIGRQFQHVQVIRAPGNLGAAGRNLGVQAAATDYIAFCDDDVCWQTHTLTFAQRTLDRYTDVAVLSARVVIEPSMTTDPTCMLMAASPLAGEPDVGPALVGFMAGACVVRRSAYCEAGGYWAGLFIGSEESLLALDLLEKRWRILYAPQMTARHWPSSNRDAPTRRRLLARNTLLVAWMRLPWRLLMRTVWDVMAGLPNWRARGKTMAEVVIHCRNTKAIRQPVSTRVRDMLVQVRSAERH